MPFFNLPNFPVAFWFVLILLLFVAGFIVRLGISIVKRVVVFALTALTVALLWFFLQSYLMPLLGKDADNLPCFSLNEQNCTKRIDCKVSEIPFVDVVKYCSNK